MKRQRGRGRKPGGGHHNNHHQPNRTLESNGPDTKVRGPASHIYERYLQLARDAASSGDRVLSENYLQHADHYFRLDRAMRPASPPPQAQPNFGGDQDYETEEGGELSEAAEEAEEAPREAEGAEGVAVEAPEQGFSREGDQRRRRGRRSRFRPGSEGDYADGQPEGGEPRRSEGRGERQDVGEPREGREPRRERAQRAETESGEGFSGSPKPAFLRD